MVRKLYAQDLWRHSIGELRAIELKKILKFTHLQPLAVLLLHALLALQLVLAPQQLARFEAARAVADAAAAATAEHTTIGRRCRGVAHGTTALVLLHALGQIVAARPDTVRGRL